MWGGWGLGGEMAVRTPTRLTTDPRPNPSLPIPPPTNNPRRQRRQDHRRGAQPPLLRHRELPRHQGPAPAPAPPGRRCGQARVLRPHAPLPRHRRLHRAQATVRGSGWVCLDGTDCLVRSLSSLLNKNTHTQPSHHPPLPSTHTTHTPHRRCRALEGLLPGCNIVKMVCAAPPLLCSDIEGSIARKLLWMREMVRACVCA